MIKVTPKFNELKVNLNYDTGTHGENNCRIVSKGSELDLMYEQVYKDWKKVQEWNERIEKEKNLEQEPKRDGAGEWILS